VGEILEAIVLVKLQLIVQKSASNINTSHAIPIHHQPEKIQNPCKPFSE
jgi:hypothetical protein